MAELELKTNQTVRNWQVLRGRLEAARWIEMSEPEVGREIAELESDDLFQRLMYGMDGIAPVLRRSRWPASGLHGGFYELREDFAGASEGVDVQEIVERHKSLLSVIRRIGAEAFERYFIAGEHGKSLDEICAELKLSLEEGRRILELVLEVSARSEFYRPGPSFETAGIRYHCIAAIEGDAREGEALCFKFHSPHWARGRYVIDYDKLEQWKNAGGLPAPQRRRLGGLLKRMELLNMRQDTLFQILSRATTEQSAFLRSRLEHRRRPLSLRELARRMGVAASTVSRAVGNRSVTLPWGTEVPLRALLSGQRTVVLAILAELRARGELGDGVTDESVKARLALENGIAISRRTVNDCRRRL